MGIPILYPWFEPHWVVFPLTSVMLQIQIGKIMQEDFSFAFSVMVVVNIEYCNHTLLKKRKEIDKWICVQVETNAGTSRRQSGSEPSPPNPKRQKVSFLLLSL